MRIDDVSIQLAGLARNLAQAKNMTTFSPIPEESDVGRISSLAASLLQPPERIQALRAEVASRRYWVPAGQLSKAIVDFYLIPSVP